MMQKKIKLTKEQILTALQKGKISYIGGDITPSQAKKHLLKIAEHVDKQEEVDLSVAFEKRSPCKIATHSATLKNNTHQNHR